MIDTEWNSIERDYHRDILVSARQLLDRVAIEWYITEIHSSLSLSLFVTYVVRRI